MSYRITYLILLVLALSSCRGTKNLTGTETANSALVVKDIIKTHESVSPDFMTMAGRIKVSYKDEKQSQSMTVSLRMEKDKKIWIKASILGITLAKVMITPEQVSYYETITNSYFDGDFSIISDWLGTDVNFQKTQAILLGQTMFELDAKGYTSDVVNNKYKLEPRRQMQDFIHALFLNPENFKVSAAEVTQPRLNRKFSLEYGPYQELEGAYYPSDVFIRSLDGADVTSIDVTYRKIDLNVNVSFPFRIPDGYEPIDLGR